MDMKVNIAGVEWKNPVTVASGTFGSGEEFGEFVDLNRLGAVTTFQGVIVTGVMFLISRFSFDSKLTCGISFSNFLGYL